jgi:hypothetical protein
MRQDGNPDEIDTVQVWMIKTQRYQRFPAKEQGNPVKIRQVVKTTVVSHSQYLVPP